MHRYDDLREAISTTVFVTEKSGTHIISDDETVREQWIFDFRALLLQPEWIDRYAEIFWELYADRYPFQVCGMETAAISLVAAIVMKGVERKTPVNGLFIRKSRKRQGLMKQIEGTPMNDPVILVDDLINSGGTFEKQIKILEQMGKKVSDIFALIAFRDQSAYTFAHDRNICVTSLFTLTDFGLALLKTPEKASDASAFEIIWHFKAPNPSYNYVVQKSSPALDDKRVYFGTDAGIFFALEQESGNIVWSFKTGRHPDGKGIFSSPALNDGIIYFGAYDGNVYALDAKSGTERWIYNDADWIGSSPSLAPELNLLFIGLEFGLFRKRGGIIALDMKTGKRVWEHRTPALTHCSPLYIKEENLVVIGSNDAIIYAYEADTGKERWRYGIDNDVKSSFAYDPKRRLVLFGSLGVHLYALSARDGTPIFGREMGAGMYSTPCISGDLAYVTSFDKRVLAINLDTKKNAWVFETAGRIFASPIIADGSLWTGSNDGRLYELDPATGKLRNYFQATERIVNKIAYNSDIKRFFVPTQANEIYCIARK